MALSSVRASPTLSVSSAKPDVAHRLLSVIRPLWGWLLRDRLLHRSVVFNIDGESYRMRSHRARTESLRKGVSKVNE